MTRGGTYSAGRGRRMSYPPTSQQPACVTMRASERGVSINGPMKNLTLEQYRHLYREKMKQRQLRMGI